MPGIHPRRVLPVHARLLLQFLASGSDDGTLVVWKEQCDNEWVKVWGTGAVSCMLATESNAVTLRRESTATATATMIITATAISNLVQNTTVLHLKTGDQGHTFTYAHGSFCSDPGCRVCSDPGCKQFHVTYDSCLFASRQRLFHETTRGSSDTRAALLRWPSALRMMTRQRAVLKRASAFGYWPPHLPIRPSVSGRSG